MQSPRDSGRRADNALASPLVAEVCTDLKLAPALPKEIYRYLGYKQGAVPAGGMASRIEQVVEGVRPCVESRGAYSVYGITGRSSGSLAFGGAVISGRVAEFMGSADRVAVFVATIGDEISKCAMQARRRGDTLAEWIIDAFGSWAAEAATDALMERLRGHSAGQDGVTLRYSPGYCGMAMDQQRTLFQMVQAEAVGVRLLPSLLMYPLKSVSGIVGLGPKEKVSTYGAPCDQCDMVGCHMRR
jgi:hypothetical protein